MAVYIGKTEGYEEVNRVIREGIESLGGISKFVKPGEKILLKPNLLKGAPTEKAVTTHPDFIRAVVELVLEQGAEVIIADSPGGPSSVRILRKFYEKSGWLEVEKETGARLNYDLSESRVNLPEGRILKSVPVLSVFKEVDGVINLPKLKTHGLTVYTGAVKNMYGAVPGLTKAAFHGKYRGIDRFSKVILDIHDAVKPRLSLMDGVLAMEGSGPAGGNPVELGMVLVSQDAYELDIAACLSVGIPPEKVTTIKAQKEAIKIIEYTGLTPSQIEQNLDYPSGGSTPWWVPDSLGGVLANMYLKRPSLEAGSCTKCAKCMEICPEDAIKIGKNGPKISWWNCIRCYCCVEVCPEDALSSD